MLLVAFLYWKPAHTYLQTKRTLDQRRADVHALRAEQARLEKRLARVGTTEQLVREARRLGLVKPGEQLFIVTGISTWRRAHQHR